MITRPNGRGRRRAARERLAGVKRRPMVDLPRQIVDLEVHPWRDAVNMDAKVANIVERRRCLHVGLMLTGRDQMHNRGKNSLVALMSAKVDSALMSLRYCAYVHEVDGAGTFTSMLPRRTMTTAEAIGRAFGTFEGAGLT